MVRETRLNLDQLIYPLFVREGQGIRETIPSMPGQYRLSVDRLDEEIHELRERSISAVILFGIPLEASKDKVGSAAYAEDGIICRALREARKADPDLLLISDVCLCEYTDHGHCGVPKKREGTEIIDNDTTLELLAQTSVVYAQAGADVVAPSDMMDGRVSAIREALDSNHLHHIPILSYAAKYSSVFYTPFRDAAQSAPSFGDRRTYQMDLANSREALKEVSLDLDEGADMVLIKPALPCLDIIWRVRELSQVPVAAYQVSGEYSSLAAAFARGWLPREAVIRETLLAIRRAGADLIITYFAKEAAQLIQRGDF